MADGTNETKIIDSIVQVPVKAVTNGPKHHFFGYYDKCPWDANGHLMLSMEVDFINHLPECCDVATIGIIDLLNNNHFQAIAQTYAWNWQQGCMLQWLPPDYRRYIIYNDRQNDRFVSIIMDTKTSEKKILPTTIYSIHPNGRYAVTPNFARLHHTRRGYGYAGVLDPWYNEPAPKNDGIYLLDLKTGEFKLIISIAQLYKYNHLSSMEDGKHWVNHLMFNADGSRFCFLHRWQLTDGGIYTRLFTANLNGTDIYCLLDTGNFSHFGWRNSKELLGWGRLPNRLNQIRKNRWLTKYILGFLLPIYQSLFSEKNVIRKKIANDSYLLFNDQSNEIKKIGTELLNEDGHCSWSPDGKWVLTDTYPDDNHYRNLILYDYEKGLRINIGKFYSLPDTSKYKVDENWDISAMRCDLHPRWNRDGTELCIDSVHEGSRQMYVLDVKEIILGVTK